MPHQLANRPRAHPSPPGLSRAGHAAVPEYPVLITLSRGYPGEGGRLPTCYSAVRHSMHPPRGALTVRLACVRRAASVHPEPGSNSPFRGPRSPGAECLSEGGRTGSDSADSRIRFGIVGACSGHAHRCLTSLSVSSISSIAVSGFQGSPRRLSRRFASARLRREEVIYAPAHRGASAGGRLHRTHTRGREGAATAGGAPGEAPGPRRAAIRSAA